MSIFKPCYIFCYLCFYNKNITTLILLPYISTNKGLSKNITTKKKMIMEAKELRIGNWVNNGDKDFLLDHNSFIDNLDFEKCFNKLKLNPIPLTEEWLLKFGFKELNGLYFIYNNSYSVKLMFHDIWLFNFTDNITKDEADHRGYYNVHQLQNLYFALTNKELNVISK